MPPGKLHGRCVRAACACAAAMLVGSTGAAAGVAAGPVMNVAGTLVATVPLTSRRPRIGLVLGGGGAKGAAHVGVLRVLEDMRVPVDCVIGTSMGALVGGTYASGRDAEQVESAIREISWAQTIGFEGRRTKLPMRRKLTGLTYSNSLEFGFRHGSITAPRGFINTQNIEQTIRYLVAGSLGTRGFDDLPIPFRAIATDMMTGDMVVLDQGDLAQSMRASMAVPGVFAPVRIDGRTLGDGGITRNVAVDIARQTCADVVIAVTVPTPPPPADDLQSPLTMISRTLDVMVGNNEREQLATLGPQDVSIVVPMGDIGSASFDRVADAIPLGREAAEARRDELRRYSLPQEEYLAWRDSARRPPTRNVELASVHITGTSRVQEDYVRSHLDLQPGATVDQQQLAVAMNRVFDLGDFDGVQYSLEGDPHRPSLQVDVTEKTAGPNLLRFDLGLVVGTQGSSAFVLAGDYLRPWINDLGGEVHGQVQFGRTSLLEASLYQPLEPTHAWFVEPGALLSRSTEDVYVDDELLTRYDFDAAYGSLEAGRVFGTSAELRVGLRSGQRAATREIKSAGLPQYDSEGYGGLTAGYTYDRLDREALATSGWLGRVRYFRGVDALGSEIDYDRLEGLLLKALPVGSNVLQFRAAGGATFEGELPFYDYFTLGGPISFPGLGLGQLRGTSYWTGSVAYLHKVADISSLFGQAVYVGGRLMAGDMSGRIDGAHEPTIFGGSLAIGGRTPLGPVTLSLATTSTYDWSLLFMLGRPIEERNISDSTW